MLQKCQTTFSPDQIKNLKRIGIDARFYGPKQKGLGRYVQKLVKNLEKVVDNSVIASERSERGNPGEYHLSCFAASKAGLPRWSFGEAGSSRFAGEADGIASSSAKISKKFRRTPRNDIAKYEFVIFLRKENWSEYQPTNPNFKKVLADYKWYGLKEQVFLPFKIWQQKIDLMHFPHFNAPIFYFKPFVVTIHDLVLKKFSTRRASTLGPFLYWLKNLAYRIVIWSVVKGAKKIIAVSFYTKKDILRYFRVEPEKIEVIYEGAPEQKSKIKNQKSKTLERYNITRPYLLYVGNAYPHKNLERLILAFAKIVNKEQGTMNNKYSDLQLVLVGELDYFYQRLKEFVRCSLFPVHSEIIFTDFLSDDNLNILYQNASLYVFPSLCEGFGLPPLEAMTFGLPVVSSQATCLPEILGQAAIYFNPENIDEIAEKIKQVLKDKELQKRLIDQGWKTIEKYNWTETAQKTIAIYKNILLGNGNL